MFNNVEDLGSFIKVPSQFRVCVVLYIITMLKLANYFVKEKRKKFELEVAL